VARAERVKPLDDPVNGAQSRAEAAYYVARYGTDLAFCTASLEAVVGLDSPRPAEDPILGAQSLAEAAFLVARYGTGGAGTAIIEGEALASLCES
jgi:hypothetical protein